MKERHALVGLLPASVLFSSKSSLGFHEKVLCLGAVLVLCSGCR